MAESRKLPRPFSMHWGNGNIVEEAWARTEHHEPTIQLMEYTDGETAGSVSLRFCTFQSGRFQRSPLILSEADIEALREQVAQNPRIRALLRRLVD